MSAVPPRAPGTPSRPDVTLTGTTLADHLVEEAATLGRRLGHPVLDLSGAAGFLNPTTTPVISVFDLVDEGALFAQVSVLPHRSQLLVLDGVSVDVAELERHGWRPDPGWVTDCSAAADLP